jgi:GDPmannose 4,6-dehydratase
MATALITGVTGQDGAYLARLLLGKGYRVHGTHRRTSQTQLWRLEELGLVGHPEFHLHEHDLQDLAGAIRLVERTEPDEVYNLAAQTFVAASFELPVLFAQTAGIGALYMLEAARMVNPGLRFYQASCCEMLGGSDGRAQSELSPLRPRTPSAVAKAFAHWTAIVYRETYDMFVACGVLFNHESPHRDPAFVTRKITDGVARLVLAGGEPIELGNLDAARDWGFAGDYVEGMWRMLQADEPDSFVLATQRCESVRRFASMAFAHAGPEVVWQGEGLTERGLDRESGRELIRVNPIYYRPLDPELLVGDASKARTMLGWRPRTTLEELCALMVDADLRRVEARLRAGRPVLDRTPEPVRVPPESGKPIAIRLRG